MRPEEILNGIVNVVSNAPEGFNVVEVSVQRDTTQQSSTEMKQARKEPEVMQRQPFGRVLFLSNEQDNLHVRCR